MSIAKFANIGDLYIKRDDDSRVNFWSMKYSSGRYYSWDRRNGPKKDNSNLINIKRIGSRKKYE